MHLAAYSIGADDGRSGATADQQLRGLSHRDTGSSSRFGATDNLPARCISRSAFPVRSVDDSAGYGDPFTHRNFIATGINLDAFNLTASSPASSLDMLTLRPAPAAAANLALPDVGFLIQDGQEYNGKDFIWQPTDQRDATDKPCSVAAREFISLTYDNNQELIPSCGSTKQITGQPDDKIPLDFQDCEQVPSAAFFPEGPNSFRGKCPSSKAIISINTASDVKDSTSIFDAIRTITCCNLRCERSTPTMNKIPKLKWLFQRGDADGAQITIYDDETYPIQTDTCSKGAEAGKWARYTTMFWPQIGGGTSSYPWDAAGAMRSCMDSCGTNLDYKLRCFSSQCACLDWCYAAFKIRPEELWVSYDKDEVYPCSKGAPTAKVFRPNMDGWTQNAWFKLHQFSASILVFFLRVLLQHERTASVQWCNGGHWW